MKKTPDVTTINVNIPSWMGPTLQNIIDLHNTSIFYLRNLTINPDFKRDLLKDQMNGLDEILIEKELLDEE